MHSKSSLKPQEQRTHDGPSSALNHCNARFGLHMLLLLVAALWLAQLPGVFPNAVAQQVMVREVAKLTASDAGALNIFGFTPVLSEDADLLVVGADNANAAYVFVRAPGGGNAWSERQKLAPAGLASAAGFGWNGDISMDTIVVSTRPGGGDAATTGEVYIYERDVDPPSLWNLEKTLTSPLGDSAPDQYGSDVQLKSNTLVVSAPLAQQVGVVHIYDRHEGGPNQWGLI